MAREWVRFRQAALALATSISFEAISSDAQHVLAPNGTCPSFGAPTELAALQGYARPLSVGRGDDVEFFLSAPTGATVTVRRLHGSIPSEPLMQFTVAPSRRTIGNTAFVKGAEWDRPVRRRVPSTWASGIYAAVLDDGKDLQNVYFLVRRESPAKLAFVVGTNTWHAYNYWGGRSFYNPNPSTELSLDRPFDVCGGPQTGNFQILMGSDRNLTGWLDAFGFDYSVIADTDLDSDREALRGVRTVLVGAHSEYWSASMRDAIERFQRGGGSIAYLGGNGLTSKVTIQGSMMRLDDPPNWRDQNPPRPESEVLGGIQYHAYGQIPDCRGYRVEDPTSQIFRGVDTSIPLGEFGLVRHTYCRHGAADGWEVDRIAGPSDRRPIAKGQLTGADMVYVDKPPLVFAVGSVTFVNSLVIDESLTKVVVNALCLMGEAPKYWPDGLRPVPCVQPKRLP